MHCKRSGKGFPSHYQRVFIPQCPVVQQLLLKQRGGIPSIRRLWMQIYCSRSCSCFPISYNACEATMHGQPRYVRQTKSRLRLTYYMHTNPTICALNESPCIRGVSNSLPPNCIYMVTTRKKITIFQYLKYTYLLCGTGGGMLVSRELCNIQFRSCLTVVQPSHSTHDPRPLKFPYPRVCSSGSPLLTYLLYQISYD